MTEQLAHKSYVGHVDLLETFHVWLTAVHDSLENLYRATHYVKLSVYVFVSEMMCLSFWWQVLTYM